MNNNSNNNNNNYKVVYSFGCRNYAFCTCNVVIMKSKQTEMFT